MADAEKRRETERLVGTFRAQFPEVQHLAASELLNIAGARLLDVRAHDLGA